MIAPVGLMSGEELERAEALASAMAGAGSSPELASAALTLRAVLDHAAAQALQKAALQLENGDLRAEVRRYRSDYKTVTDYLAEMAGGSPPPLAEIMRERDHARAKIEILARALSEVMGGVMAAQAAIGDLTLLAAKVADRAETDVLNVDT